MSARKHSLGQRPRARARDEPEQTAAMCGNCQRTTIDKSKAKHAHFWRARMGPRPCRARAREARLFDIVNPSARAEAASAHICDPRVQDWHADGIELTDAMYEKLAPGRGRHLCEATTSLAKRSSKLHTFLHVRLTQRRLRTRLRTCQRRDRRHLCG
jgi:hypothetical protein